MLWQNLLIETQLINRAIEGVFNPPTPPRQNPFSRFFVLSALTLASLGLVAMIVGLFLWLGTLYAPEQAVLYTGVALMLLAGIFGTAAYVSGKSGAIHKRVRSKVIARKLQSLLAAVSEEIEAPIREYPKTATAIAAIVGIVAGEKYGKEIHSAFQHTFPNSAHVEFSDTKRNGAAH